MGTITKAFVLKVIKRGFSLAVGIGLARLGVFLKNFEKETIFMNLCNVNSKVPDLNWGGGHFNFICTGGVWPQDRKILRLFAIEID